MAAAKKIQNAHAALKGVESRNGFLSDETLLQFVGSEAFQGSLKRYQNERLRAFREFYRELDRKILKTKDFKNRDIEKRRGLIDDWLKTIVSYFGYQEFQADHVPHWDGEGTVPFLRSKDHSHSVAVLFGGESSIPLDVETSGHQITTPDGVSTYKANKRERLSEQVERMMKASGCSEAVLFLVHSAYYFRAESQTSGQYLEIRWSDILLEDNDAALALASHLLHSDFFAFSANEAPNEESATKDSEGVDEDENDEAEGVVKTQTTASALLFKEDLEQARKITEDLHKQVTLALEILINERLDIEKELKRRALTVKENQRIANDLFKDGLFVLYRTLFILYAEARRFLPVENTQFASFYSLEHLRDWAEDFTTKERQGLADANGTYIWGALQSLFTLLRRGKELKGGEMVSAFNGQLFAPDQAPLFDEGPALRDKALARVLLTLTRVGGEETGRRLHFANLGIEQLGAVYEALLAQKPVIVREESIWVPAHGGGAGLVTIRLADKLQMVRFEEESFGGLKKARGKRSTRTAKGHLSSFISVERPGFDPAVGTFIIAPLGGQKRQTASFYTPPKLAEFLVKRTLKPLVEGKISKEILNIRLVEPAVGSGGFLIAALRYIGGELLKAKIREKHISLRGREASFSDLQECKRQVLESCLFGVDLNPLSLELCRTSLYLEALVKNQPLPFLHHRLKSGNSLIYADYLNQAVTSWDGNIEFPAIFDVPLEALKIDEKIYDALDASEQAHGKKPSSDKAQEEIKAVSKKIRDERDRFGSDEWAVWAVGCQEKVHFFLQECRKAVAGFERIQNVGEVVDSLDIRYKDRLAWIPDLDPVLIEAEGIEIDPRLELARKSALIREHGKSGYAHMVRSNRAFARLKALGDLWCAQWFWSLENIHRFPTPSIYREIVNFLLDENTLERRFANRRSEKNSLSKAAFATLKMALSIAREHRFFQWHVEFSQVFADTTLSGFSCLTSNPPWKVVGVKDKDVFPEFDPQFLDTKPADKSKRIKMLSEVLPDSAHAWFRRAFNTGRLSKLWQQGILSPIGASGQVDLSTLFTLGAERLVRPKGRIGLIVSRSAVFSNNGTASLRERFFGDYGLREAISFSNTLSIFEIGSHLQFTCLIAEAGKARGIPRFIHGVVDLNLLDSVSRNLDALDLTKINGTHVPIEIPLETIRYFSRQTLSVPGFANARLAEIARAIHEASGPTLYLDDLDHFVKEGIHQTAGPKKGHCQFAEKIPSSSRMTWNDVKTGNAKKWVPLFRGRDYDRLQVHYPEITYQYGSYEEIERFGYDFQKATVVWRKISQATDQRTMVVTIIPPFTYTDYGSYLIQLPTSECELALAIGCLPADFLMKLQGGANRTKGQVESLPIANYRTGYLEKAVGILKGGVKGDKENAEIDALMWLHYGFNQLSMQRDGLIWALENHFVALNRNKPGYVRMVIEHFDRHVKNVSLAQSDLEPVFRTKVVSLPEMEIPRKRTVKSKKATGA